MPRRARMVAALPFLFAAVFFGQQPDAVPKPKGATMTPEQVVQSVKRQAWPELSRPGAVPAAAGPALLPLLDDPNPQVRELAVFCLEAAGGPAASKGLMKALNDRTETISAAAARALVNHYAPEDMAEIRRQLSEHPNEVVREHLALLLGKTNSKENIPVLMARKAAEKDREVNHAAHLALARLGQPAEKQEIADLLLNDDPKTRVDTLRDLPYVNDRGLLAKALPLLDDLRLGLNVGPSHGPYYIRVCDVVVNIMDEMLNHPFSFKMGLRRYSPEELAEAKAIMASVH